MENIKLILNRFEPISDDSFNELSKLITKKTYAKKSFLIKKQKDFDKFFLLTSGSIFDWGIKLTLYRQNKRHHLLKDLEF